MFVAPEGVLQELKFWLCHVEAFNSYPINRPLSPSAVLTCDAGESGYGAHLTFGSKRKFCSGMWSSFEGAVNGYFLALKSHQSFIMGKKVKIFSDNQKVVRIVHNGSSVPHLQQIAVDIFSFCLTNSVSFQTQWIPRAENELADYLSRIVDSDDWMLSPDLFKLIANMWGLFDVDRTACSCNCHLPRFNTKVWCPGTEAVDCFTQDLGKDCNNFVCVPPHLIRAFLYHMETCKAKGTLFVPEWKSAPFWPLLYSYDFPFLFPEFVKDFCYSPRSRDMFLPGRGSSLVYTNKKSVFFGRAQI